MRYIASMKAKLIDISTLKTPINYAKQKGVSRQRVYLMMQEGKLDYIEIDGTKFITLNKTSKDYRNNKTDKVSQ